jgi:hypothetical protein
VQIVLLLLIQTPPVSLPRTPEQIFSTQNQDELSSSTLHPEKTSITSPGLAQQTPGDVIDQAPEDFKSLLAEYGRAAILSVVADDQDQQSIKARYIAAKTAVVTHYEDEIAFLASDLSQANADEGSLRTSNDVLLDKQASLEKALTLVKAELLEGRESACQANAMLQDESDRKLFFEQSWELEKVKNKKLEIELATFRQEKKRKREKIEELWKDV